MHEDGENCAASLCSLPARDARDRLGAEIDATGAIQLVLASSTPTTELTFKDCATGKAGGLSKRMAVTVFLDVRHRYTDSNVTDVTMDRVVVFPEEVTNLSPGTAPLLGDLPPYRVYGGKNVRLDPELAELLQKVEAKRKRDSELQQVGGANSGSAGASPE